MALLARLKSYNPKKGFVVQTYMIDGVRFHAERGWYEIDDALADKLRGLTQDHYDPESPALFDLLTRSEAEALERAEAEREANARASALRPARAVNTRLPAAAARTRGRVEKDPDFDAESALEEDGRGDLFSEDVRAGARQPTDDMEDPDPDGAELNADAETDLTTGRAVEVGRLKPASEVPSASEVPRARSRKPR